jgi:hypothetical protein
MPDGKRCQHAAFCWQHLKHKNRQKYRDVIRSTAIKLSHDVVISLLTLLVVLIATKSYVFVAGMSKPAPTGRSYSVSLQESVPTHDTVFQAGIPVTAGANVFPALQGVRVQDFVAPAPSWTNVNATQSGFNNLNITGQH